MSHPSLGAVSRVSHTIMRISIAMLRPIDPMSIGGWSSART